MQRAIGISVHTGWAACVVVGGSLKKPQIIANEVIEMLGDSVHFCFHMAAEMKRAEAGKWIARARDRAVTNARRALAPLVAQAGVCAIVAKEGDAGDLDRILASHSRIHTAEGCFYRDVFCDACAIPVRVVPPSTLDASRVGKIAPPPWGRDQKIAALAAWTVMRS
ncbi:MAG: hypothetical protein ACREQZ_04585 [Woeseiaceae bacterium]